MVTAPSIAKLEMLPGYWLGRAKGRELMSDRRDLGRDRLHDQQAIAQYERRAAEVAKNGNVLTEGGHHEVSAARPDDY